MKNTVSMKTSTLMKISSVRMPVDSLGPAGDDCCSVAHLANAAANLHNTPVTC